MPLAGDSINLPKTMQAMVFETVGQPLIMKTLPVPVPSEDQVGVCRTDLHIIDGELAAPKLPLVPGMRSLQES